MAPRATLPTSLRPTLGVIDLTLIGVGASIGAGIFVLTGVTARKAGPAVVFSFGIAAVVCALDALCYAELGSRIPRSGSAYLYARVAFGEGAGLIAGANLLFDYGVGAAAIARSLVGYVSRLLHDLGITNGGEGEGSSDAGKDAWTWSPTDFPAVSVSAFAPLILFAITAVLCLGIKETRLANNVLTLTKMGIVIIVILAGVPHAEPRHLTPFVPNGAPVIFSTAATVFFAYIGFDAVSNAAEECSHPQRDLPRGILLSLIICAILYSALTIVLCAMVPYSQLDKDAPLTVAFASFPHTAWIRIVVDVGAVVGLSTCLLIGLYSQSRIYLAIARDGLLPAALTTVAKKGGSPYVAQIFCGGLAALLAAFFDVEKLSEILSIGVMAAYAVVCAAVIVLRFGDLGHAAVASGRPVRSTSSLLREGGGAGGKDVGVSSLTSLQDELNPEHRAGISQPSAIGPWSSQTLHTQASVACCGVCSAGALAAAASSSSVIAAVVGETHIATTRVVLGTFAGAIWVCCTASLQWLFYEHPWASAPLDSGFSCPLVRWVPIVALSANGFLAGQLPWPAWLRLAVLSCVLTLGRADIERRRRRPNGALSTGLLAGEHIKVQFLHGLCAPFSVIALHDHLMMYYGAILWLTCFESCIDWARVERCLWVHGSATLPAFQTLPVDLMVPICNASCDQMNFGTQKKDSGWIVVVNFALGPSCSSQQ